MKTLIIYHHACADGTFAAAITGLAYTGSVAYLPMNYAGDSQPLKDVRGKLIEDIVPDYDRIVFVDFSLPEFQQAAVLSVMAAPHLANPKVAKKEVLILDHHGTRSMSEYESQCSKLGVDKYGEAIFDSTMSGALLSYFHHIPMFRQLDLNLDNLAVVASLVSDRDTFVRTNLRAIAFYEGTAPYVFSDQDELGTVYQDLPPTVAKARDIIVSGDVEKLISAGFVAIDKRDALFRPILAREKPVITPDVTAPHFAVEAERGIRSELLAALMGQSGVGLAMGFSFSEDGSYVSCSWRSVEGSTPTAKECANIYDGNGHPTAAGCSIPFERFAYLYPHLV